MFGQEPSISVQKCSPVGVVAGMLCVPVLPCELTFLACPHLSWCSIVPSLAETMPCTMEVISPWCFVRNTVHMASPAIRAGWGHKALQWQALGDTVQRFPSWIPMPLATLWSLVERLVVTWHKAIFLLLKGKFSTEKKKYSNGKFLVVPEEFFSNLLCVAVYQFNLTFVGLLLCCLCLISDNRGRAPFQTNVRPGEADIHY